MRGWEGASEALASAKRKRFGVGTQDQGAPSLLPWPEDEAPGLWAVEVL